MSDEKKPNKLSRPADVLLQIIVVLVLYVFPLNVIWTSDDPWEVVAAGAFLFMMASLGIALHREWGRIPEEVDDETQGRR